MAATLLVAAAQTAASPAVYHRCCDKSVRIQYIQTVCPVTLKRFLANGRAVLITGL